VYNLYSLTKGQATIREFTRAFIDTTGNLPPLPGSLPDYRALIVRNGLEGRELAMARWGMSSLAFALKGKKTDPGVTNVRNMRSPHWRRWLGVESRCVVPFTSFSENEQLPDGSRPSVWFALDESRPVAFFAGIWDGLDLDAKGQGRRDDERPLRLSHDRAEQGGGCYPP
jgi:putative SOS response-associated peptidase YedK